VPATRNVEGEAHSAFKRAARVRRCRQAARSGRRRRLGYPQARCGRHGPARVLPRWRDQGRFRTSATMSEMP